MTRKQTWVPEHYQPAQSSWRRATCERTHTAMLDIVTKRAGESHPAIAAAIDVFTATNWPAVMWLPTAALIDEIYDAVSQRDDVSDEQAEQVRHWLLDAQREAHPAFPHLGKLGVCERCGAPAFDDDGEQPDACWAGECKAPGADERYAALLAMTGETVEELERING